MIYQTIKKMKKPFYPVIFIVDGNSGYLKVTQQYLSCANYTETLSFSNIAECVSYLDLNPDIVICDIPVNTKFSGRNILKQIKEVSPTTEIIFFTSNGNVEDAVDAVNNGALDFIMKSKTAHERLIQKIDYFVSYKNYMATNYRRSRQLIASLGFLVLLMFGLVILYN